MEKMTVYTETSQEREIRNSVSDLIDKNINEETSVGFKKVIEKLITEYYLTFNNENDFIEKLKTLTWEVRRYSEVFNTPVFSAELDGISRVIALDKLPEDTLFKIVDITELCKKLSANKPSHTNGYRLVTSSDIIGYSNRISIFMDQSTIVGMLPENSGEICYDACLITERKINPRVIDKETAIKYGFTHAVNTKKSLGGIKTVEINKDAVKFREVIINQLSELEITAYLTNKLKQLISNNARCNFYPQYSDITKLKHDLALADWSVISEQNDLVLLSCNILGRCNRFSLSKLNNADKLVVRSDGIARNMKVLHLVNRMAKSEVKTCALLRLVGEQYKLIDLDIGGIFNTKSIDLPNMTEDQVVSIKEAKSLGFTNAIGLCLDADCKSYNNILLRKAILQGNKVFRDFYADNYPESNNLGNFQEVLCNKQWELLEDTSKYFTCETDTLIGDYIELYSLESDKLLQVLQDRTHKRILAVSNVERHPSKAITIKLGKFSDTYKITEMYAGRYIPPCNVKLNTETITVKEARNLGFTHAKIID